MDRYPAIVWAGAAVLGKVAAEMALTDPLTARLLAPPPGAIWAAEAAGAGGVIVAGRLLLRVRAARFDRAAAPSHPGPGGDG
jgi:predicted tellurium resistance membrane protein TerC